MCVIDERVMVVEVWFACVRVVCVGLVDMVRHGDKMQRSKGDKK